MVFGCCCKVDVLRRELADSRAREAMKSRDLTCFQRDIENRMGAHMPPPRPLCPRDMNAGVLPGPGGMSTSQTCVEKLSREEEERRLLLKFLATRLPDTSTRC